MTQTQFTLSAAGASQCDLILARLDAAPGQWIPMPELWRVSGAFAVHSRIADLRRRGYTILQRSQRAPDGTCLSSYQLVPQTSHDTGA